MFRAQPKENGRNYRVAIVGLLLLSAAALAVTIWVMNDFLREQEIVEELIRELPADATAPAEVLAGELKWQFRLSILVVLNVVVTGIAVALLWRAYRASLESLRDIKALARDILSSVDQAVITTNLEGTITSINSRGLEMFSPPIECVGQGLNELSATVPLEEFRSEWMIEKSAAMTRDFNATIEGNDRVLRAFGQTLSNIDEAECGFILQVRDVTERALMQDQMRRMERYMGLGSLAVGLHHEIKNPLAALSLHAQLLEEQLTDGDASADVLQMLSVIKTEMARVGSVLEGFRDFASTERLDLADVNLLELVRRQLDLVAPQSRLQSVSVELEASAEFPQQIRCDRVRLEQVLLNLFVNALESMPNGGQLTVSGTTADNLVVLEVQDTGNGIPEGLREKILDPYFTTKGEGTGLGLALCDKIMRQHDGSLDFRSSPQGTVFQLTLPAVAQTEDP